MTFDWQSNPLTQGIYPTLELVDEDRKFSVNLSTLPDGSHVVSLSQVIEGSEADARSDLWSALGSNPLTWVAGRTHLELGKIDDLTNNRTDAVGEYRQAKVMCNSSNDPFCASEADRWLDKPFRFPK